MKIKRFVAKDMRSALAQIKEVLGVDAVIMSNKKIPEGVELMAAIDYQQTPPSPQASEVENCIEREELQSVHSRKMSNDVVSLGKQSTKASNEEMQQQNRASKATPADSLSALLNRQVQQPIQLADNVGVNVDDCSIEEQLRSFTDRLSNSQVKENKKSNESLSHLKGSQTSYCESVGEEYSLTEGNTVHAEELKPVSMNPSLTDFQQMQEEMASIRSLLEHQVSGLMWQDMAQKTPQRALLLERLLQLGLTEQLADQIAGYVTDQASSEQAWQQAKQFITKQINTTQNDIINRGGVVALVGPTGVGKTTTVAKLAAGYAQAHGRDSVALISTDTFRIAGFEQLSTYGKIIGCNVSFAQDTQALNTLLEQYASKKLILIDTAGMGQRDIRLAEQLTSLVSNARVRIRSYLVLAANSQQAVMQENVDRFKHVPIAGCIYTKLDESISIGECIATSIQNGLPIGYVTDGQRVPEDIKVANAKKLVSLADKMAMNSVNKTASSWRTTAAKSAVVM